VLSTGTLSVLEAVSDIVVSVVDGLTTEVSVIAESEVPSSFLFEPHPAIAKPAMARIVNNLNFISFKAKFLIFKLNLTVIIN
jgi:hypothetical protein